MTYDEMENVINRADHAEMVKVIRMLWGFVEMTKRPARKPRVPREEGKPTWLTPIAEAYEAEMEKGTFPYGLAAKTLRPLVDAGWSPDEVARRLSYYLRDLRRKDEVQYLSLPRFKSTFASWDPSTPAFRDE